VVPSGVQRQADRARWIGQEVAAPGDAAEFVRSAEHGEGGLRGAVPVLAHVLQDKRSRVPADRAPDPLEPDERRRASASYDINHSVADVPSTSPEYFFRTLALVSFETADSDSPAAASNGSSSQDVTSKFASTVKLFIVTFPSLATNMSRSH